MKNKKKFIIFFIIGLIIGIVLCLIYVFFKYTNKNLTKENYKSTLNYYIESFESEDYYIFNKPYVGDYEIQYTSLNENNKNDFIVQECMNYNDYKKFCQKWNLDLTYTNLNSNYLMFSFVSFFNIEAKLADVKYDDNIVTLFIYDYESQEKIYNNNAYVIIIPTKEVINRIEIQPLISQKTFYTIKGIDSAATIDILNQFKTDSDSSGAAKPIIYLYPKEETPIIVKLKHPDKITVSYPKYTENGWNVLAKPDGSLINLEDGRNLYSLYWEGKGNIELNEDEGFVVKKDEIESFLEEKLAILGLNEKEAEEFIIYWLPKLKANNYNFIRFATIEEINEYMPLEFSLSPDCLIRILMQFKGLDNYKEVKEQTLKTTKRSGFVAVEWGGMEY